MSEYGVASEAGTIRFERLLPGTVERVWAYLTESDKRGTWLASGEMEPRAGGRVQLKFRHADLSPSPESVPEPYEADADGITTLGRVTRWDPPRLLSYTWNERSGEHSEVTFELSPRGADVVLVLTHRRLSDRTTMLSVAAGWHVHLTILFDRLEGRTPGPFWTMHQTAEAEYEQRLPAA